MVENRASLIANAAQTHAFTTSRRPRILFIVDLHAALTSLHGKSSANGCSRLTSINCPHRILFVQQWRVDVIGAAGTLYEGEKFSLQFRFTQQYPFNSPEVMFVGENIPVHPHVYSNGHICLSILSEDWTPALSVQAVCLSILSMLSSAREKKRPPDNALYVRTCNKNPSKTRWWFHGKSPSK
ncbi:hypothetical protein Y032_0378g301 [Ancylostoma ceylanicum]|uniref:N-terminal E2 ubiquitin-conjugating enzyme n=1 Tax=Ancylostoma ceylanicum TaxID=53326 RepID=A0A016RTC3_9BILA|nr:hypothetical protein Y032_0378g301 [Ancylostoma ceylanicum]